MRSLMSKTCVALLVAACSMVASAEPVTPSATAPPVVSGGRYYLNGTADALVKTGPGILTGIFVASSTTCTIKLWDNTSAATTILVNTFSANAATWYPVPFHFRTGLYIDITNTCDYTVSYS